MIGLDTNVLVRYLVQDDPLQSPLATRLLEGLDLQNPGVIQPIVLCELVWVLETAYAYARAPIASVLRGLLHSREIVLPDQECVAAALLRFEKGSADFSDHHIQQLNLRQGCSETVTFDRKSAKSPQARLPGSA